jgi:5'-nucleotidase / UDP-sugar diphosphatase
MRTICKVLIILLLTIPVISYGQEIPFTFLHFSDSHSHLTGTGPKDANLNYTLGGFPRIATVINNTRNTDTNVMVFHCGDFFTGDFFSNRYFGAIELSLLGKFKLDAIAIGNHEFDLGPLVLFNSYMQGFQSDTVPVVSANIDMTGFPVLNNFISPYIIKNINGVKLGIFGLTYPDPSSNPFPVIINDSIMQIAANTVQVLNSQGCNVIVCLSHLGLGYDRSLASIIPGIHIILGGHSHNLTSIPEFIPNPAGFNTIICHPGEFYKNMGKLKFVYSNGNVIYRDYESVIMNESIPENQRVKGFIDYYKAGIVQTYGNVYDSVISTAVNDIKITWEDTSSFRDTPAGNLVTDSYRNFSNTQIGITALGLLSEEIYAGPVTGNDLFRLVPYGFDTTTSLDFRLVNFSITGGFLKQAMELVLAIVPDDQSYLLQTSGLTFDFDLTQPIGQRVILSSMKVNDTPFVPSNNYRITVNQGLFYALQQLGVPVSNIDVTSMNEYTALKIFVSGFPVLNYVSQGRIKEVMLTGITEKTPVPADYVLYENYPNPFNSSTKIKFYLKNPAYTDLKVYDITGRTVAVITQGYYTAGLYTMIFNANSLSSGIYFYRLTANGNVVSTKRMSLIK